MSIKSIVIIILLLPTFVLGQIKIHKTYTTGDGLINGAIKDIFEDSYGYIWFATESGASRWDGINFKNFTTLNGLAGSYVMDIEEGKDSTLYFCTFGKGITTLKNNKLDTLTTKNGLMSNFVSKMYKKGDKLFAISGGNLQLYNNGKFFKTGKKLGIPTLSIDDLIIREGNEIILTTGINGIYIYKNGLQRNYTIKDGLNNNLTTKIVEDTKGNFIVGTDRGPNKIIDGKVKQLFYKNKPILSPTHDVYFSGNNKIFYSTSKGVFIEQNNKLELLNKTNGLPSNIIWKIFEDSNGKIYFGTNGFGFSIYENDKIINYPSFNGIGSKSIMGIVQAPNGKLIIASAKSIFLFDPNQNRVIKLIHYFPSDVIHSIKRTSNGDIFVTNENGVVKLRSNKISEIFNKNIGHRNNVYCSAESDNSEIYFGTRYGLIRLKNKEKTKLTKKNGLAGNYIISLYFTKDGTLLIGTHGQGMSFYKNGKFKNLSIKDGLSDATVNCFLERKDGTIWVGTNQSGINILNNNTIIRINTDNGLLSNTITALNEDEKGRIFVSTTKGLNIIEFVDNELKIRSITTKDGLIGDECTVEATIINNDGIVWIGTTSGLSRYNPDEDKQVTNPPKIYITDLEIFNQPYSLEKFLSKPELSYDENFIKFIFTGINLSAPEKIKYKYRLSGIDKNWVETSENFAPYTNLDDGEYTFEVKARNEWGYWSKPVSASFVISPAWWETWWFYALVVLAIGSLIAFVSSYKYRHLLAIEKMRSKISADLHDSIGSGLTEISILTELLNAQVPEDKKDFKSGLNNVSTISRSLIESMSDIVWLVNPKKDTLKDLFKRLQMSYQEVLKYTDIDLLVENLDELETIKLPMNFRQHLYLIFKEAINNAIKYSGGDLLNLKIKIAGNNLTVLFSDNGKGYDQNKSKMGNGLVNMKNRAKQIGGIIEYFSVANKGTTIKFTGKFSKQKI